MHHDEDPLWAAGWIPLEPQEHRRDVTIIPTKDKHAAKVIVQLTTVWGAWANPRHRQPYLDLLEDLTDQDTQRVTVLYVSRKTRTPEAPGNEPHLRRRPGSKPMPRTTGRTLNGNKR